MRIDFQKNGTKMSQAFSSILFCLYSLAFTCFYQWQELALMVHRLTGGVPLYLNRWVVGVLLTSLLLLLQRGVYRLTMRRQTLYALSFVPSFLALLCLPLLTRLLPLAAVMPRLGLSLVLVCVGCALFGVGIRRTLAMKLKNKSVVFFIMSMWLFALMMFSVAYGGAMPTKLHRQIVMETLIRNKQFDKALEVGRLDMETDSTLTSLRVLALANEGLLGDQLFEFPLQGKSAAMMPNGTSVKWHVLNSRTLDSLFVIITPHDENLTFEGLEYHSREHKLTKPAYDYLLCGYLLDRKLDAFAANVFRYYPNNNELPKHYREALTLYMHMRSNPIVSYRNNLMETDYQDFQDLEGKYKNRTERKNALRNVYGNTYWFYYAYGDVG